MNNDTLSNEYSKILKNLDVMYLDRKHPEGKRPVDLSGLFLTSVFDEYRLAKNKIMIIGSETKGWSVLEPNEEFTNLDDYIKSSMNNHQRFFKEQLEKRTNSKGLAFHNFTRAIANKCGKDGLIYSNLFCFAWNKKSPIHCKYFETIKKYSELLLKVQIEVLKPQVIIFANGMTSVPYRREFFPIHGENQVCKNGRDYSSEGIPNHHLWEFDLYNGIRCYRIHHPSAQVQAKEAAKARKYLINLLPSV